MDIIDQLRLGGKKALVTGAASGIGKSTAAALAQAGADVAIVDLKAKEEQSQAIAKELSTTYGVKAISVSADISDPKSVKGMMEKILGVFGTIDVVHSNAGIVLPVVDTPDISYEDWNKLIGTNLTGMFLINQAAGSVMVKSGKGGSIINTASMTGSIINEMFGETAPCIAYAASKAGVIQLTKGLAAAWAKHNVRVNAISPGYIDTPIFGDAPPELVDYCISRVPMGRRGKPEELGGLVVFLASDASSYITGANILIDGGYTIW